MRGTAMAEHLHDPKDLHLAISWEIEVLDDFRGAIIEFVATPTGPDADPKNVYSLAPALFAKEALYRLRSELDGLIEYMEKGVHGLPIATN
jgi:hypothetical protein